MLYYMLTEALMAKSVNQGYSSFKVVYDAIHDDPLFRQTLDVLLLRERSIKRKIMLYSERMFNSPVPYKTLKALADLF